MASAHSPTSPTATIKKDRKDDSGLFERIGTFGRKKKAREGEKRTKNNNYRTVHSRDTPVTCQAKLCLSVMILLYCSMNKRNKRNSLNNDL